MALRPIRVLLSRERKAGEKKGEGGERLLSELGVGRGEDKAAFFLYWAGESSRQEKEGRGRGMLVFFGS